MKTFFKNLIDNLAETALLEEGGRPDLLRAAVACDPFEETIEENLVEVAFAEAADYDDIHKAILREHAETCKAA